MEGKLRPREMKTCPGLDRELGAKSSRMVSCLPTPEPGTAETPTLAWVWLDSPDCGTWFLLRSRAAGQAVLEGGVLALGGGPTLGRCGCILVLGEQRWKGSFPLICR